MKKLLLYILLLLFFDTNAQKKIIFRNGTHRASIKVGKQIGITKHNELFNYSCWDNVCNECNNQEVSTFFIDSIQSNYIIVSETIPDSKVIQLDTFLLKDISNIAEFRKKHRIQKAIYDSKNKSEIEKFIAFPLTKTEKIYLDSIASFSFAKYSNCSSFSFGLPLMDLVLIIGTPIAAFSDEKPNYTALVIGETAGIALFYLMYRKVKHTRIKTYQLKNWTIKVR